MPRCLHACLLLAPLAVLSACETARSLNPLGSSSPYQRHCRAALDHLVSREAERQRISVEKDDERRRDANMAVTIVYVQGESRRLFTCIYDPDVPNRVISASYRGQPLSAAQIEDVNANAGRR